MDLKHLVLAGAVALCASVGAQAQVGVYGHLSGQRVTGVPCRVVTGCANNEGVDYGQGGGGGVYYDFTKLGPARIGADVRYDRLTGNKSASYDIAGKSASRYDSALAGVRATFHVPITSLHPYGEVAVGWAHRVNPQSFPTENFLAYRAYAGLDIAVAPILDIRVPEVGIGQNIGMGNAKSNVVESVSIGIVFHMPR